MGKAPILEMRGIVKRFGSAIVNDHVDLSLYPGEVLALLGENGAGKSTLMNILFGMYQPNEGTIYVRGEKVTITSPKVSLAHRIGMVHQNFMLIDSFTATENILLTSEKSSLDVIHKAQVAQELNSLADQYGIAVDLNVPVGKLSVGMQQKVEILKLLYTGAEILIFDEPTAVLAPQECEALFSIIKKMIENQKSVIFISHKLEEVLRISDRIMVLQQGRVVEDTPNIDLDQKKIVEMMIGEAYDFKTINDRKASQNTIMIEARDVCAMDARGVQSLNGVSFHVRKGEILGIAGLEGNGQDELMDVLAGVTPCSAGSLSVKGTDMTKLSTDAFMRAGISYVPSDRNHVATVSSFRLFDNWPLRRVLKRPFLAYRSIKKETEQAIRDYDVRVSDKDAVSENLSGGNLQKFILGREISKNPEVLICSNPTRGIDVKASWAIRNRIIEAKDMGMTVVISSGDFEELFYMSDRILVMYKGKIFAETTPKDSTVNRLGSMMMGVMPE